VKKYWRDPENPVKELYAEYMRGYTRGAREVRKLIYEKELKTVPAREWAGLDRDEIKSCWLGYPAKGWPPDRIQHFYEAVEKALKEKNA
jgi:hypothetical protein